MGINRRQVVSLLAPVCVVSLSGCSVNGSFGQDEDHRPSTPQPQQSTDPVRGKGDEVKIVIRRPTAKLLENNRVKNTTTGEILDFSQWQFSIASGSIGTELCTIIRERSSIDPQEYNVQYLRDDHSFLVSVLVEGPPEGVQELAVPEYFTVKRNCPHKILSSVETRTRTVSRAVPVYVRAVLDPVSE